jgi:hypothetical protein
MRVALGVESLEERMVLSTLTVTSSLDPATPTTGTLRDAVRQANIDATSPQHIADTIEFAPGISSVTLSQGQLDLQAGAKITIDGKSAVAINGNQASRVFLVDPGAQVDLSDLTITQGKSTTPNDNGGGVDNFGALTVRDSTFFGNSVTDGSGGGLANEIGGTVTVANTLFAGNNATGAGGLENLGTATVTDARFVGNTTPFFGGGIENGGTMQLTNSTLTGNTAGSFGGAVHNTGSLTVSNSTFAGQNSAQTGGGAIDNNGKLTLSNSTLTQNSAGFAGGAIDNEGALAVSSSTISGNTAGTRGGGIDNFGTIFKPGDPISVTDTIVAGNTATKGPDIFGAASGSFNFIGNGTAMTGLANGDANHNRVGTGAAPLDPRLGPLQDNGGPTQTMALQGGSLAFNTGGPLTTLASGIDAGATTLPVASTGFTMTPGPLVLQVGSEQMLATFDPDSGTMTVQRGFNNTPVSAHSAGDAVYFGTDQRGQARVIDGHTSIGAFQNPTNPSPEFTTGLGSPAALQRAVDQVFATDFAA